MTQKLNRLERQIMREVDAVGRKRVIPTEKNMNCAADLCERGLMVCEKVKGKAIYSLTDAGREALKAVRTTGPKKLKWVTPLNFTHYAQDRDKAEDQIQAFLEIARQFGFDVDTNETNLALEEGRLGSI